MSAEQDNKARQVAGTAGKRTLTAAFKALFSKRAAEFEEEQEEFDPDVYEGPIPADMVRFTREILAWLC